MKHASTHRDRSWVMPNLLQWEELAVGRVSEDETISFLVVGTTDEHSPAQETKQLLSIKCI